MKILLFILLPTLISARISIEIIPASNNKDASVLATGSDRASAEAIDVKAFHLTDNEFKEDLCKLGYLNPYITSKDLNIVLKPVNARIVKNNERNERIPKKYYTNNIDGSQIRFEPDYTKKFEEILRTRWYETPDISVGRNIDIKTWDDRINRASAWGQDDYESKKTKLVQMEDSPIITMQNYSGVIHSTLTSTEIRVDYEASLEGKVNFKECIVFCLKNRELEINDLFHQLETSKGTIKAHQIININYYREIELAITDLSNPNAAVIRHKLELETF